MKKKLIVISVDAMVYEDIAILKELKNFNRILSDSSVIKHNTSTYPTLTHAVHTSIYTGCYPIHHGIPGNEIYNPYGGDLLPWYEDYSWIRRKGIGEIAEEQGYKTALIYWPVTVGAPDSYVLNLSSIHYPLSDELKTSRERSSPGLFDEIYPYTKGLYNHKEHHQEEADKRACISMGYLIRKYQPDVMYMHLVNIDEVRHNEGVFGPHIASAYKEIDKDLDGVFSALDDMDLFDKTIFCFTSDHGQMDIDRIVALNVLLEENNLLTRNNEGRIKTWDALFHAEGMHAELYIRDHDKEITQKVLSLLNENKERLGIGTIMDYSYLQENYHISGDPDYIIDTDGHTTFSSRLNMRLVSKSGEKDYRYAKATHGYLPEKGPQPLFFVRNPYIKTRVTLEHGRIIDQMPTLAYMLGLENIKVDGKIITDIC